MQETLKSLIQELANTDADHLSKDFLLLQKRKFAKAHKLAEVPSNTQLIRVYQECLREGEVQPNKPLEQLLRKRAIRSESGIVPIQVLTKPFRCPGKCIFCPNDFTMPKSYINTEPGAMRALLNNFDPIKQVYNRLLSLTLTGHDTDKIEMIVLGGTWDVYPQDYKTDFIKKLYDACNSFPEFFESVSTNPDLAKKYSYTIPELKDIQLPDTIDASQKINEAAAHRIIGLTVETRPEYVTDENCQYWRTLGVTRLEVWLQNLFDDVLDKNKRGHSVQQCREAVHKLRQYGFKMSLHMMPGLYGSTYEKDLESFRLLYADPFFKPDEIKFYPTSVIPNTELYDLYVKGEYKPLEAETIQRLIKETFLNIIPPYTRIKRLIRDIPSTEIIAGSSITNLSQLTHDKLKKQRKDAPESKHLYSRLYPNLQVFDTLEKCLSSWALAKNIGSHTNVQENTIQTTIIGTSPDIQNYRNFVSLDTRSREIRNKRHVNNSMPKVINKTQDKTQANLVIRSYPTSVGTEHFISFEDSLGYLYGLCRLSIPTGGQTIDFPGLDAQTAIVRELHVYGQLASLRKNEKQDTQHRWFGSQLIATAERIAAYSWYHKLSIIAGVGVKAYYRKLGYIDIGTYVQKIL